MKKKVLGNLILRTLPCILVIALVIVLACYGNKHKKEEEVETFPTIVSSNTTPPIIEEKITITEEEMTIVEEPTTKSNEEIAEDVIAGLYGDGQERIDKLTTEGYDADIIQLTIDEKLGSVIPYLEPEYSNNDNSYYDYDYGNTEVLNPNVGVVYYNDHKETYYSQQVLPGGGLNIPGRYVAEDGTVRDEEGYICVAADPSYLGYGSTVETSLGTGKVYDSGCDYGTIDIYTNW